MIYRVFTVYDSKAEFYFTPFFVKTVGEAIRSFTDACNDASHQFHKYKEDFTLFELGTYDDSSASFDMLQTPKSLGVAIEFVKSV